MLIQKSILSFLLFMCIYLQEQQAATVLNISGDYEGDSSPLAFQDFEEELTGEPSNSRAKRGSLDYSIDGYTKGCKETLAMEMNKVVKIVTPYRGRKQYPEALECEWEIIGDEECHPVASCEVIDLRKSEQCSGDQLIISDGGFGEEEFCGPNLGFAHYSSAHAGPYLWLNLKTEGSTFFDRLYKGVSCTVRCHVSRRITRQVKLPAAIPPKEDSKCHCGQQFNEGKQRIVGGEEAKRRELPWQVAIVETEQRSPFCGGSFINNGFVLTAAHCILHDSKTDENYQVPYNPSEIQVIFKAMALDLALGDYDEDAAFGEAKSIKAPGNDVDEDIKEKEEIIVGVEEIIVHQHYNRYANHDCDIALLRLQRSFTLSSNDVPTPICIPPLSEMAKTYEGQEAIVSGWGKAYHDAGSSTKWLQKVKVPVVAHNTCASWYDGINVQVTENMLCAGFEEGGKDACQGDSGGPLVTKEGNRWIQIGVVSFGEQCAAAKLPGIYTNVNRFLSWIHHHTRGATWCQN